MKRPMLVSGIALALSCAVLVFAGTYATAFLLIGAVAVFILYLIKPLKLRDKIIIPAICVSVLLGSVSFILYNGFKVQPCLKYSGYEIPVSGKIIDIPVVYDDYVSFTLKTEQIGDENFKTKISVTAPAEYREALKVFDYVSLPDAGLTVVYDEYNKLNSSYLSDGTVLEADCQTVNVLWQCEKTPYYYCLRLKTILTEQINAFLVTDEAGFLRGMLFGDKNDISDSVLSDFRASGIAHLLAVSGLHTSLWCGLLIALLTQIRVREKLRNAICLLFLCGFCIISAFTPSVLRASLMMASVLIAPFFKRRQDSLNSLGLAVTLLLLINPYIITSVSFQLSAMSTLGVLCATQFNFRILDKTQKINNHIFRKIINYLLDNICISAFAGLFTLPVSAYYFGVFSLASPITNILCVQIAFWGMLCGVISTAVSFIPFYPVKTLAIYLFKITSFLLNIVTDISGFIADFKFCSVPIHNKSFYIGLFLACLIFLGGFILYKKSMKKILLKASAVLVGVTFILSLVLPCTTAFGTEITVFNVGNGANICLRSGLRYAYFNCGTTQYPNNSKNLPRATAESLNFLYISETDTYGDNLSETLFAYSPSNTVITSYIWGCYRENGINPPSGTLVSNSYNFDLNSKINIETVDTYSTDCVIIRGNEKSVFVCYGDSYDITSVFSQYGTPDILIISGTIPKSLPENVKTLIISSDSDIILNKNTQTLKNQCENYYTTAENGDVTITL